MSDQQALEALLPAMNAITLDTVQRSTMPINNYVQEALNLFDTATQDFEQLSASGLSQEWLDSLQQRIAALRAAQQNWVSRFQTKKDAQSEWAERRPLAYDLREEVMAALRFATRGNSEAQSQLDFIDRGTGHEDMLGDLNNLAGLGRRYRDALNAIHFDFAKLELAETNARELGTLLSQVNGDELEGNQERVLRDRAYTYLRSAVEEVRAYGKYVFRSSPRLHGYQSDYNRQKNARRNPEPEE